MRALKLLGLSVSLIVLTCCGGGSTTVIVDANNGGQPTDNGSGSGVTVVTTGTRSCAGTVIAPGTVLTSANCADSDTGTLISDGVSHDIDSIATFDSVAILKSSTLNSPASSITNIHDPKTLEFIAAEAPGAMFD